MLRLLTMDDFWRNLARLLRSEGGDVMAIPSMAIVVATGVLTFVATRNLGVALGLAALSFPLQGLAFINRTTGYAVAGLGSLLVASATALLVGPFVGLLVWAPLGWLAGFSTGAAGGWLTFRRYEALIREINDPAGWH